MNALIPALRAPVSPELAAAVSAAQSPHPDVPHALPALSDAARREIGARLAALNVALRTATADQWTSFLKPFVASVSNPPSRDEFTAKASMIAFGLSHIPGSLLTEERCAEGLRRFKFWPSVSELGDWLQPIAARLRAERSALEGLRDAPPVAAAGPRERTEAERAHANTVARAFAADMAALNKPRGAQSARASYVEPLHLALRLKHDLDQGAMEPQYRSAAQTRLDHICLLNADIAESLGVDLRGARARAEAVRRQAAQVRP